MTKFYKPRIEWGVHTRARKCDDATLSGPISEPALEIRAIRQGEMGASHRAILGKGRSDYQGETHESGIWWTCYFDA